MAGPEPQVTLVERASLSGLDAERVQRLVSCAWGLYGGPAGAALEVVLMGGEEHTALHAEFLDDPSPTDVMAFPYDEDDLHGEVLVNLDMARAQAAERGLEMRDEAELYVVHGVLHLLGFDDRDEVSRARMRDAEQKVFEKMS